MTKRGKPVIVGIGGQAGAGKSEFAAILRECGARVIDADRIGWSLLRRNTATHAAVARAFGPAILKTGQDIDRRKLGRIVFADPSSRRRLNRIVHPSLLRELRRQARAAGPKVRVIDAALLFFWGLEKEVDLAVLLSAHREVKLRRLMGAGLTRKAAAARLRSQLSEREMARRADVVVSNNGTRRALRRKARAVWELLRESGALPRKPRPRIPNLALSRRGSRGVAPGLPLV